MSVPLLSELLAGVSVAEPARWSSLHVFLLAQANGHAPTCVLIDDLLETHQAEITEISDAGAVPTIKVLNRSALDALILDGTELRGARQNRMVNVTIIAGHGAETLIPVSCVEAGRWSFRARGFASSKRTVASRLRNMKAHQVARSGTAAADQGEVWAQVRGYLAKAAAPSPTEALDDAFATHDDRVESAVASLGALDGCGAVVAIEGEILALDLFACRETFRKAWPGLLRGYAIDAILGARGTSPSLAADDVRQWLRELAANAVSTPRSVPGVGTYHAVRGPALAGGIAEHHGRAVHVALFPSVRQQPSPDSR